jgi:hypothetical protein
MMSMSETKAILVAEPPASTAQKTWTALKLRGILFLTVLVSCGAVSAYRVETPVVRREGVSVAQFSSARAMKHVQAISANPHPLGTVAHDVARDYIVGELARIGLEPQIQKTVGVSQQYRSAASLQNILARLKGSASGKAVLLVAHYDSFPTSRGASDDGAGVAAILECARALKSLPALRRDVIFLFTDGEEAGLLGAGAFVKEHPWARDVGVVFNFEARGTSGPAIMFETSDRNGWLIGNFAAAASDPVADSVSYEIYSHLSNDTDFTVFKKAGYSGLNFAFINHLSAYHSLLDNPGNLDPASLQHEGDYLLQLAQRFGNAPADDPRQANAVYFDFMGVFVHYPGQGAAGLLAIASLLFAIYIFIGTRKQFLGGLKLLTAAGAMAAATAAALFTAWAVSWVIVALQSRLAFIKSGLLYNSGLYVGGLAALGLACAMAIYAYFSKRLDASNLAAGGVIAWFLLLWVASILWPSASYLLLWPLIFTLLAWIAIFSFRKLQPVDGNVLLLVPGFLSTMLVAPILYKVFTAFAADSVLIVTCGLALLLGLLSGLLGSMDVPRFTGLAGALASAGSILLIAALATSGYDNHHPKFDSLFHALDSDTGSQVWATFDKDSDQWTSQVLFPSAHSGQLAGFFPGTARVFLQSLAAMAQQPSPVLNVLENKRTNTGRELKVRVISPRHAPIVWISFDRNVPVKDVMVNGKQMYAGPGEGRGIVYYAVPPEGLELSFETDSTGTVRLDVKDVAYDLLKQAQTLSPRPQGIIPAAVQFNDSTIVKKTFVL